MMRTGVGLESIGAIMIGVEVRIKNVEHRSAPFFPSFGMLGFKCEADHQNSVELGLGLPKTGIGRGVGKPAESNTPGIYGNKIIFAR